MSNDGLKQDLITTDFKAGEQPDHLKLTASVDQLKTAVETTGKSIGDVHSGQTHTGTQGGGHTFDLGSLPNATTNLSRLIGSGGFGNPRHWGRTPRTMAITFAATQSIDGDPATIDGFNHWSRREFKLPYAPIILTSTEGAENLSLAFSYSLGVSYWTIGAPDAGYTDASAKATTRVASLSLLTSSGQYYVNPDGTIVLYDALDDSAGTAEAFKVTYQFHVIPDRYDGATLNVVPDFSQVATLCSVAFVSGTTFNITLPTVTARRAASLISWIPPDEVFSYDKYVLSPALTVLDPMYGVQAELPTLFRQNFVAGDVIPDGAIYLWDEQARDGLGEIVSGITFSYLSTTSVQISGIAIDTGATRYRLLLPGSDIAQAQSVQSESYYWHDHSGRYIAPEGLNMGHRIRHFHLLNLIDEGGKLDLPGQAHGYRPSTLGLTRNPHPQYLHRDGYRYKQNLSDGSTTTPNFNNALMGDLLLGNTSDVIDNTQNSYSLFFGAITGPQMRYSVSNNALMVLNKNLYVDTRLWTKVGISSGADSSGSGNLIKWFSFVKQLDNPASGDTDISGLTLPSDWNYCLGVQCAVIDASASPTISYFTQCSVDEAAANQHLSATLVTNVIGTTLAIHVEHGSDLDGLYCRGVVFYA